MRDRIARGFSKGANVWVSGYYVKCRGHHYILQEWDDSGYDDRWEASDWVEVEEKSVGDSTGLKDKNGKKIFEGDIVKKHDPQFPGYDEATGQIIYCSERMGFRIDLISGDDWSFYYPDGSNWSASQLKIIGNIFEYPELLKG